MGRDEDAPHRRRMRRSNSSESMTSVLGHESRRSRSSSPHKKKQHAGYPYWWLMVVSAMIVAPISFPSGENRRNDTISDIERWQSDSRKDLFYQPDFHDHVNTDEGSSEIFKGLGIRWHDDIPVRHRINPILMPILTERRPLLEHHHRSATPASASLSMTSSQDRHVEVEPSLEDIELIDVLWRSDLAQEKGGPAEQYERDIQALTEKEVHLPLSREDASRFEDLSKSYFEEYYSSGGPQSANSLRQPSPVGKELYPCEASVSRVEPASPIQPKIELPTPTDAELDALLEDVWKEGGPLDRLGSGHVLGLQPNTQPLLNNVSLGLPYTAANLTEIDMLRGSSTNLPAVNQSDAVGGAMNPPAFNATNFWYNHTADGSLSCYLRRDAMSNMTMAVEQMPAMPPPAPVLPQPTLTEIGAMPTGHYSGLRTHSTQTQTSQASTSSSLNPVYDPYYGRRSLSMSNESSICSSASSSSTSPRYGSETENHSPIQSRFYGKLAPLPKDEDNIFFEEDSKHSVVRMTSFVPGSQAPRRRGRQSKDEQLAAAFQLPVSAAEIADMTLPDLQKMLRSEDLNEDQKQLIKKIRRRGKNKVAARTCRLRRGEMRTTHSINVPCHWMEAPRNLFRRQ